MTPDDRSGLRVKAVGVAGGLGHLDSPVAVFFSSGARGLAGKVVFAAINGTDRTGRVPSERYTPWKRFRGAGVPPFSKYTRQL